MHTITLNDGDSYALSDRGLLKIEIFPVGRTAKNLRLAVGGHGVHTTDPYDTLVIVRDIPSAATLTVSSTDGGDFGIDQAVRVTVTHANETLVEFPVVRIGGIAEKVLGTVAVSDDTYVLTAFGSSISDNVSRPVMAVASALRARMTSSPDIRRMRLVADTGAAFHRSADTATLTAAVTVAEGIASVLGIGAVDFSSATGTPGPRPVGSLLPLVTTAVEEDRTRVGASSLPVSEAADEITVYLTATPVSGMVPGGSRSVILVPGPGGTDEEQLYAASPDRAATTAVIPVTAGTAAAVVEGESTGFAAGAGAVAAVLSAPVGSPATRTVRTTEGAR